MNSSDQPLITTIIPTYRRPRLLRRAIESALEQGGTEVLVRVFDNASGDETSNVVAELAARDPRLVYYRHDSNIGAIANFEFGLRRVDTPYFSLLSDDDYLLPGFYQKALDELERVTEAKFWAGMTLTADEMGKIWYARVDQWTRDGLFVPPEGLMMMMHGMAPLWTGVLFRRAILDDMGYPDQGVLGPSDLDFMLRAGVRYRYILRKYPSAVFTLHATSFSSTQPLSSFWPGWQKMFRNLESDSTLMPDLRVRALHALHQDAQRMLFRRGANALCTGRYDYSRAAVSAFESQYGKGIKPQILHLLTAACQNASWFQRLYTWLYLWVERRLIASHSDLETRFGHLIRRA